jgi:predicted nucleic acid-binding protein
VSGVLVDTSVWRGFFSGRVTAGAASVLSALLDGDAELAIHPAVLGELVLGGLSAAQEALMQRLPPAPEIPSQELLRFVRHHELQRRGVGWVDSQLLASALAAGATLWSLDKPLARAARDLGAAFDPRTRVH